MKKIRNLVLVVIFVLSLLSCGPRVDCIPPLAGYGCSAIDWENYNDVPTVFSNNNLQCSDVRVSQNNGKDIKVYGWLMIKNDKIIITHDSLYALGLSEFEPSENIPVYSTTEIQTTIISYDLTQKCYLKGELKLEKTMDWGYAACCQMSPRIVLKSINDINFE